MANLSAKTTSVSAYFSKDGGTGVVSVNSPSKFSALESYGGDLGTTFEAGTSEFSNAGANVDQDAGGWKNAFVVDAQPFNDGGYNTTASSPYAVSATSELGGYEAWHAFDGGIDDWVTPSETTTGILTIDLGVSTTFAAFRMRGAQFTSDRTPRDYTIEARNGTDSWTVLHTVTGQDGLSSAQYTAVINLSATGSYDQYRLNVTLNNGDPYLGVGELEFYEGTLQSTLNTFEHVALNAGASTTFNPSTLALTDSMDLALADGDVTIRWSGDNGSTWSSVYGLNAFTALGVITDTDFRLEYTLIGTNSMKASSISSTATNVVSTADGIQVVVNGVADTQLGSKGIAFNGDSADANYLNDYEEGTFTPAMTNIGTGTYASQNGTYTKIGDMVHVQVSIDIDTLGTASGNVVVEGLPFSASAIGFSQITGAVYGGGFSVARASLAGGMDSGAATVNVFYDSGSTPANLQHSDLGTGILIFSLTYKAG